MEKQVSNTNRSELVMSSLLNELVNHLGAMLAFWDANQVCVYANKAYYDWFGKPQNEVIGLSLKAFLGPIYQKNIKYIEAALSGKTQIFEREIPNPNGGTRHSITTYTPYIVNDEVLGFFVHVSDVTALKNLENQLRQAKDKAEKLATHDFLTGLPNRVLLNDRIHQAVTIAERTNKFMAVMSLDIDDFKLINDNYGHSAGDEFLKEIANRIKKTLRNYDTVTRMGGDEFLILATEIASEKQLCLLAERILNHIKLPLVIDKHKVLPACSLGIVLSKSGESDPQLLISESDKALYKAKNKGKNQYLIVTN